MCGIYGQLKFSLRQPCGPEGEIAVNLLRHRGPDEEGKWGEDGIFLGMRRLSIIDLTGGQQPIWNEDHTCVIIYNGELYNFLDLRPELQSKGHVLRTRSDTEVILHSYEEWGKDCLQHFNGMFAFAIWDNRNRTLFLARDRIGEKPLYYYQDQERIIFASEIKAILADSTVPRRLNLNGLANFLAFGHAVAPATIYQDIFKLLPGHYLLIQDGRCDIKQYWDVGYDPRWSQKTLLSEDEFAEKISALLDDSVRRRMVADVPVGAFLSGGVDSSAVVALMKRHATERVKSFSLGFTLGGAYDELNDARMVADYLGTEHYELRVDHVDLPSILQKLVYHYDEPFGDAAGFPIYLLSRFAREHVKVVLAGDGGDELFGGYRRYVADQLSGCYRLLPNLVTKGIIQNSVTRFPRLRRLKRAVYTLPITDPATRYAAWLISFTPEMQAELLEPHIYAAVADYDPAWSYPYYYNNPPAKLDHLNRLMYTDLKTWLPDTYMEKVDKASMACSLEVRLPMLDHRLVELAFQIPSRYKIRRWATKLIFKKAVRQLIPSSVLRKPKHGFAVPTDPWFRGSLKEFAFEILFDERTKRRGYFHMPIVERMWQEHSEGRQVWDGHLWLLLNFELWHRIYLDGDKL